MRDPTFRGDPYRELGLQRDASASAIKRRWRELARQHHPDRAAGNREETDRLTERMARINAAYDLLRDPLRRARYDEFAARANGETAAAGRWRDAAQGFGEGGPPAGGGPPPPPVTRPVTGRFDTSSAFWPRNTTLAGEEQGPGRWRAYPSTVPPRAPRARREQPDLRASTPTGPVERRHTARTQAAPSLREAREAVLEFGKHRGYTLGEVELLEPTYIDWIAQTITRDRELVQKARVIQSEMDRQGVSRRVRTGPSSPFGSRAAGE